MDIKQSQQIRRSTLLTCKMKMFLGLSLLLVSCTGYSLAAPGYNYNPAQTPQLAYQQNPVPQVAVQAPQVAYQHKPALQAPVQAPQLAYQHKPTFQASVQAPQFQPKPVQVAVPAQQLAYQHQPALSVHAPIQAPLVQTVQQQYRPTTTVQQPQLTGFAPSVQTVQHQQHQQRLAPIITKNIYLHAAPNDFEDDSDFERQLSEVPLRKNYRIVFIKAPTPSNKNLIKSIQKAQALNEEKTVIYVLSKKNDASELQKQLADVQHQTAPSKPEVFFIKYRTPEEAAHAQNQIQAQYDALGGSTQINDEGIAPLTSVIGTFERAAAQAIAQQASAPFVGIPSVQNGAQGSVVVAGETISAPSTKYLPQ